MEEIMFFSKYLYSLNPWLVIGIFVASICIMLSFDWLEINYKKHKTLFIFELLFITGGFFLFTAWIMYGIVVYRNNAIDAVDKAIETEKASEYATVHKYKVESYSLTPDKYGLRIKAQVRLTNGEKINDVDVQPTYKLNVKVQDNNKPVDKNSTSVAYYDANLKPKYQPLNKNKFRQKILVITEKSTSSINDK
ncbi:hypothetical protein [Lactobacillus johnsonii]|uniref:Uncharacterized protein n=1 Tax=Lactobacillus johnsonii TaxID=33959 RepID=A0A9X7T962_LACJH|nr:hypothetical protein [Lactobacillus johnsonii]QIA88561.1 hypothetical protein FEE39_09980 [Lactobacillus johnsonii]QIA88586.1 hypothetical protein FEE39_10105 [Lactobacillus johnsonii]